MFAVIKTGSKQYKVAKDNIIKIEKIDGAPGSTIEFKQVLMIGEYSKPSFIGAPIVNGAVVTAKILDQLSSSKVIVFKKKRRKNYRKKSGHKQELTQVKIIDISKSI
ncbi:ribosomal protein L21 [Orientia chuto str. Dubai]|uniref:Large ribosomal subunit protein bL21 n=1 Tax=Orientia chuto str. Dubai TaxID=1359168 RepID=A0A0F3MHP5_9RICK|nr:50S ribosomal protein L21 [Candidatus Orientia mediorientalis]KJV55012.1 ribosomal protein L21 [Orientia chuto str. Dubai]